ncbi:hypothetical protein MBCUT_16490 [Methanobrevibacter cuticularis]|uniref:UPF0146 protein MBCUT_16490 n=1 Tax=Methanobrevibacter cuticularis TaxID=47311 RepID=A0A166D4C3_9EURY|nr:UPF0146 family protein [Methanobrevibacter cuticularis]KZX15195.1 hypothetical protein MBCUT_16490 [Methanobrevibacter cuticularis]
MWADLGEYIIKLLEGKSDTSQKVVEIGVGKLFDVSNYLNEYNNLYNNLNFIMTDIAPANDTVVYDDITNPKLNLYKDAKVIYSIRPPSELQPYLGKIIDKTGSILIIKPLFNEDININKEMSLVNYKKAVFYEYSP